MDRKLGRPRASVSFLVVLFGSMLVDCATVIPPSLKRFQCASFEPHDFADDDLMAPWTSDGNNSIAMVMYGTVSYCERQSRAVKEMNASSSEEFVPLGPVARLYGRYLMRPNNAAIDIFLFSWAPLPSIAEKLLRLYQPLSSRFENYSEWLPRFEHAIEAATSRAPFHALSQWTSVSFALELMREHEAARGWRYDHVVLARPDVLLMQPLPLHPLRVDEFAYHHMGVHNTHDLMFVLSSAAAERLACLPHRLANASLGYSGFMSHRTGFLPRAVPALTGLPLVESIFRVGNNSLRPENGRTQSDWIKPFRKRIKSCLTCNGAYDDAMAALCHGVAAAPGSATPPGPPQEEGSSSGQGSYAEQCKVELNRRRSAPVDGQRGRPPRPSPPLSPPPLPPRGRLRVWCEQQPMLPALPLKMRNGEHDITGHAPGPGPAQDPLLADPVVAAALAKQEIHEKLLRDHFESMKP